MRETAAQHGWPGNVLTLAIDDTGATVAEG
jgi:hypothetical protein